MHKEINKRLITKLPLPGDVGIKRVKIFGDRSSWRKRYCVFYLFSGKYLILKCGTDYSKSISPTPCKLRSNSLWTFKDLLLRADIISNDELDKL